jgi:hypothetical protein
LTALLNGGGSYYPAAHPPFNNAGRKNNKGQLNMKSLTLDDIRTELEQVIRCMPPKASMHHGTPENLEWLGRAGAIINVWGHSSANGVMALANWNLAVETIHAPARNHGTPPTLTIIRILFQAQNDLRVQTVGPVSVTVGQGQVFQYFDEVRKIIEQATTDILFVDPYLNADFISRYLPHVKKGVAVRLLCVKYVAAVKSAAELFARQNDTSIEVRAGQAIHDRWFFIDGRRCFQSGASFKDGGVNAATTLIENVDSFVGLRAQFEERWQTATI